MGTRYFLAPKLKTAALSTREDNAPDERGNYFSLRVRPPLARITYFAPRIPHAPATKAKSLALVFSLFVLFLQFREVVNSPIT